MAEKLNVLLLEDNPGDAFLMKFYLGESASPVFEVSHAETLASALELLSSSKFDIILSDMNLPDSFGIDTIKTILEKFPGNLVMVLTGLTDEEVGLETVRYGAQDFLVKGKFDGKVLISTILFAFERFKLNKQIDNVSAQLSAENIRLDAIQNLLNVGYVEYNSITGELYQSPYALKLTGHENAANSNNLNQAIAFADNPEQVKQFVEEALKTKGIGNFTYQRKGISYSLKYQCSDGIFYGVIQSV